MLSSIVPDRRFSALVALVALAFPLAAQDSTSPSILRLQLDQAAKLHVGRTVSAHTTESLFVDNQVIVPAGSIVTGKITDVRPVSRSKRLSAVSRADFTPLKQATIEFDTLTTRNGSTVAISTTPAQESSEVLRFRSTSAPKPSLFKQLWFGARAQEHQAVVTLTAPGKADRAKKYLYARLPYHPQQIDAGTQYEVTLLNLPVVPRFNDAQPTSAKEEELKHSAVLHARLQSHLDSAEVKAGDPVTAIVTQPLTDDKGKVEVPEGAILRGKVLRARKSKSFGRNGALRFTFQEVQFQQGFRQGVSGVPKAVDSVNTANLRVDNEGGVEQQSNKGVLAPLALGFLATSTFTEDENTFGHSAVGSNGFGLIGRVIGIASGSKAAGVIGWYGTARTVYSRFLAHGKDVEFRRNAEVEIEVGPVHQAVVPQRATH